MRKTLRFAELVRTSGKPEVATVWTNPKKDPDFSKAIKENRVLTVKTENVGARKDSGRIGFYEERNAAYLIFPEELPRNPDARVVGIDYEQLKQPSPRRAVVRAAKKPVRTPAKPKSTQAALKKFSAVMRRTVIWERTIQLEARDLRRARKLAERLAAEQSFDHADAITRNEIRHLQQEPQPSNP